MANLGNSNADLFEILTWKLASVAYSRTEGYEIALSNILDQLLLLDFNSIFIKNHDKAILVINQCCSLIPPDKSILVEKACLLFSSLITKQQVLVEGKTLSLAVCWCLDSLKFNENSSVLKCLQVLVGRNGKKLEKDANHFINEIVKILIKCETDSETHLLCVQCVQSLVCSTENDVLSGEIIASSVELFKQVLTKEKIAVSNEVYYCKSIIAAMRGLEKAIQLYTETIANDVELILGIIKGYMLYGLPGQEGYKGQKIVASQMPEMLRPPIPATKKLRGKYDKKSKKCTITSITRLEEFDDKGDVQQPEGCPVAVHCPTASDSDFSDGEVSQNNNSLMQQIKVRHCALILLATCIQKIEPKRFLLYLPNFLPDGSEQQQQQTLMTCLLKDSSAKCRSEVAGILSTMLSNSKKYFCQADSTTRPSFTTFSNKINNMINQLHSCLILALNSENSNLVINRILKCISDLIRCSPYHKLESGLITELSRHVKPFLKHKDVNVRTAALTVFGCIASVEPKIQEVKNVVLENEFGSRFWLFQICFEITTDKNNNGEATNIALVIESLQVMGALVRNFFFETVITFPDDVIYMLEYCSKKSEYPVRLYSGKLMETVFNSLQFSLSCEDESKRAPMSTITMLWETLLQGPVTSLIQSFDEPMLRCTGCDCIANIGVQANNTTMASARNSFIFDLLPRDKQIICISHLFGCIRDESPAVKSSSARALAIFVLFPSLREDALFFLDAIDAASATANDSHNGVRLQSAWLLGNISESIALVSARLDGLTPDIIFKLMSTSVKLTDDVAKTRPGALRSCGNLLKIVDRDFLSNHRDSVAEGIDALIKNATTGAFMKARWNSCYALANAFQNPVINSNKEWVTKVMVVMINLVQGFKNFKVRISAGHALSVFPTRQHYGDDYGSVWMAVLDALENSKNVSDYNEYQHRDQLADQLSFLTCHLIVLMELHDLTWIQDFLPFHFQHLQQNINRWQERIVPEKSNIILNAKARIQFLKDHANTTCQKTALDYLTNLLTPQQELLFF